MDLFLVQADIAGLDSKHLMSEAPSPAPQAQRLKTHAQSLKMTAMRQALACVLQQPALASRISESQLADIHHLAGGDLLAQLVDIVSEQPQANTAVLLEHLREHPHISAIQQLSVWQAPEAESLPQLLSDSLRQLQRQYKDQRLNELLNHENQRQLSAEEKQELSSLLKN